MPRFSVLGPLEVLRDGQPVLLGAKRRIVLAWLLLRANRVVSIDELADGVWADAPPSDVRNAMHTLVSRLRREIGANVVSSRAGGYLAMANAEDLDLLTMRELDVRAARAAQAGDLNAELEALDKAVRMWRGDVLVDVRSERLHTELVPALHELRLQLVERRTDALLRMGRHDELISDLTTLTGEHPLRERFWAQLIRALCHAGRQAEALETYRTVACHLAEEFGVDPGTELRELHARILAGEDVRHPNLARALSTNLVGHPPVAIVPRQLPPDVVSFTGRNEVVAELTRLLEQGAGDGPGMISAIGGIGGIGKSALAIRIAHSVADQYPDGQLYVNLRGATAGMAPLEPIEVLGRFLRSFGLSDQQVPSDVEEASARFRSLVDDRRILIVLDDAHNAAQVHPLLPAGSGCAVLVTSRSTLAELDGAQYLHLDVLTEAESVTLLARLAGEKRIATAPEAAARICRLCGHLPLALRIAGARLAARPNWPITALVDRLADARKRLDELRFGELAARTSFQVTYDALAMSDDVDDRAAARAFCLLGLPEGPDISTPIAARLLDEPEHVVEQHLERLAHVQLLSSTDPGRYYLHDLLRLFARDEAARSVPEHEQDVAIARVWRCYVATSQRMAQLLRIDQRRGEPDPDETLPLRTRSDALKWADAERANLLAAAHRASTPPSPRPETTIQLASALFPFLESRAHWHEAEMLNQRALHVARSLRDHHAQAQALSDLAGVAFHRSQLDTALAHLNQALRLLRNIRDRRAEATALRQLGTIQARLGDIDSAVASLHAALTACRETDDRHCEARALNNLANDYLVLGDFARCVTTLNESLDISRAIGDRHCEAVVLASLGEAHARMHEHTAAGFYLKQAIALQRELGQPAGEGEAMAWLCETNRTAGHLRQAISIGQQAVSLTEQAEAPYVEALARWHLRNALTDAKEHAQAHDQQRHLMKLSEKLGRPICEIAGLHTATPGHPSPPTTDRAAS